MTDTRPVAERVPARPSSPDTPTYGITRVDGTIPGVKHVYRLSNAWVRPEPAARR